MKNIKNKNITKVGIIIGPQIYVNSKKSIFKNVVKEKNFVDTLYTHDIKNIQNYPRKDKILQGNTYDRARFIKTSIPRKTIVTTQSAAWIYTNRFPKIPITVENKDVLYTDGVVHIRGHVIFSEDIMKIKGMKITSPEKTLIDLIRYSGRFPIEQLFLFKKLKGKYKINKIKLKECITRIESVENMKRTEELLKKHGFI